MTRYVNPQPRYVNSNGKALSGGKLNFYSAGTVTRRNTYSNASFTIENQNPVILDANGRPQTDIFLDGQYKVVLTDSNDNVIWEKDPVGGTTAISAFADWINDATYDVGDIVTGSDGRYYRSVTNGNVGLDPTVEAGDWERVQLIREWRNDVVYQTDDVVFGGDDVAYQSLTDNNLNNDPDGDQVNWSSVKDYWGSANGVATLDSDGLVPSSQIPPIAITDVHVVADQAARLALTAQVGDVAVQNDNNTAYILQSEPASTNSNWIEFGIQNFGSSAFRDVGTASSNIPDISIADARYLNESSNLGDLPNVGAARDNLELGSASTRDVGTASGNVAEYTSQGLSGYGYGGANAVISDSSVPACGFQVIPSGGTAFYGIGVRVLTTSSNSGEAVQFAASFNSNRFFSRYATGGTWQAPVEHWHDGNLPNPVKEITTGYTSSFTGKQIQLATSGTSTRPFLELVGNYSSNTVVSGVSFHNLLSSDPTKRICQLAAERDGNDNAGRLVLYTATDSGDIISAVEIDSNQNTKFNGDVTANNYYPTSSDERLKNKLRPVVINYRQAAALQSWVFQWKDMEAVPESQRGKVEIGLMAQEVMEAFPPTDYPSLVIKKDNGYYTIDPDKILMMRVFAKVEPRIVTWYKDAKGWINGLLSA